MLMITKEEYRTGLAIYSTDARHVVLLHTLVLILFL